MVISSENFSLMIIPLMIFLARIADVTFGTIRIIFISRGVKNLATIFGFCEIMIWLFAISQIIQHVSNFVYYMAYASGYAKGDLCWYFDRRKDDIRKGGS